MKWIFHRQGDDPSHGCQIIIQLLPPFAIIPIHVVIEAKLPQFLIPIEIGGITRFTPTEQGRIQGLGLWPLQFGVGKFPADLVAALAINCE